MAIVQRANKQLTVSAESVESYLADGFDELNEDGTVKRRATGGRTVTLQEHYKVVDALNAEIAELKAKLKKKDKAADNAE